MCVTTPDPRAAALADLREWAENQATARQRLIAAAWRAGVRNVAELSRTAGVSRDTVYEDLRRENIDPTKRSAMPNTTVLSRRA
jgi:transcriptional regulator of acetoin/glycerol metabolism